MPPMAQRDLERVKRLARQRQEIDESFRQAIIVARASGETLAAIASAAALSPERVRQILRETERR